MISDQLYLERYWYFLEKTEEIFQRRHGFGNYTGGCLMLAETLRRVFNRTKPQHKGEIQGLCEDIWHPEIRNFDLECYESPPEHPDRDCVETSHAFLWFEGYYYDGLGVFNSFTDLAGYWQQHVHNHPTFNLAYLTLMSSTDRVLPYDKGTIKQLIQVVHNLGTVLPISEWRQNDTRCH